MKRVRKAHGLEERGVSKLKLKMLMFLLASILIAVSVIYALNIGISLGRYNASVNVVEEVFVKEIKVRVLNATFAEQTFLLKQGDIIELKLVVDGGEYAIARVQYRPGFVQIGLETTVEFSEPKALRKVIDQRLSMNVMGGESVIPLLRAPLSESKWIYIYSFWLMNPLYIEVEVLESIKSVESIHLENQGDLELVIIYRASLINGTSVEISRLIKPYSSGIVSIGLREVVSSEVVVSAETAGMNMRVIDGVLVLIPRNSPLLIVLLATLSALTAFCSLLALKDRG